MPDIREILDRAAPPVGEFDASMVAKRARRRRVVPRAVAAVAVAAVAIGGAALFAGRGDDGRARVSSEPSSSTSVAPSTTTTTLPAYVDPSPNDPALQATVPRCNADDLRLVRSQFAGSSSGPALGIFLTVDRADPCALLSYPAVEGLTADGTWETIPVYYDAGEAVSSVPWQGVVDPAMTAGEETPIVTRLDTILPSYFPDGTCPNGALEPRHYSDLRFVLRDGGGVLDLPGVALDVSGCATVLHAFGYDHLGPN